MRAILNVQTPPNRSPGAFRAADGLAGPLEAWMVLSTYRPIAISSYRPSRRVLRGHVTMPVVFAGFLIRGPQVGPAAVRLGGRRAVLDHDADRSIGGGELASAHGAILVSRG